MIIIYTLYYLLSAESPILLHASATPFHAIRFARRWQARYALSAYADGRESLRALFT